jgi:hypothetical protein
MLTIVMRTHHLSYLTRLQLNLVMMSLLTSKYIPEEAVRSAREDSTPLILINCDIIEILSKLKF